MYNSWEGTTSILDDIMGMADKIDMSRPKGPRIDESTLMFTNLTTHALSSDSLVQIEKSTGVEILWVEYLDSEDCKNDGKLFILNPTPFGQRYYEYPIWPLV